MSDLRLERLEERMAWLERHVVEQDKVIHHQAELLKKVGDELVALRERQGGRETPLDPNERPPHY